MACSFELQPPKEILLHNYPVIAPCSLASPMQPHRPMAVAMATTTTASMGMATLAEESESAEDTTACPGMAVPRSSWATSMPAYYSTAATWSMRTVDGAKNVISLAP